MTSEEMMNDRFDNLSDKDRRGFFLNNAMRWFKSVGYKSYIYETYPDEYSLYLYLHLEGGKDFVEVEVSNDEMYLRSDMWEDENGDNTAEYLQELDELNEGCEDERED